MGLHTHELGLGSANGRELRGHERLKALGWRGETSAFDRTFIEKACLQIGTGIEAPSQSADSQGQGQRQRTSRAKD
jgi:hypothetical protein